MSSLREKLAAFGANVGTSLGRWPVALAAVVVLGVMLLLPGLGRPGLWEPHERQLADRVAPPADLETARPARVTPPAGDACPRAAPDDAAARSLGERAPRWGRDLIGDSDAGRRLPFALMGLLTALATAGIAMRLAGARAGVIAAVVVLSMPLLALQSRMLTSEIGTACGGALLVYALVALARLRAPRVPGGPRGLALAAVDAGVSVVALVLGATLGFYGGGALLGLVVPIGAVAAAGGLGVPLVASIVRREGAGRVLPHLPAALATLAVAALVGLLAHDLYDLVEVVPGKTLASREVFGYAIVPEPCWSDWLGAVWRPEDDLRAPFDSTFEQIAYGTFPWGVLAPVAMAGLLRDDDRDRRCAGAVTLAWGAGAWFACEAFARKAGFSVYAGFPALAVAIGVWLDVVLSRRARGDRDAMPGGMIVLGLFFLLAVVDLGKDMHSFPDRITSLLVGTEQIKYPAQARLLALPTKTWILLVGAIAAVGVAMTTIAWRRDSARAWLKKVAAWGVPVAFGGTIVTAAFWSFVWQPRLAEHLSSRAMFETYKDLRGRGDQLVIMGDLGHAPRAYADATPEMVPGQPQIVEALGRGNRVFAIAPQTELCTLHRELSGKRYYVLDNRNVRNLLLSNRVDGTTDKNPLATAILHAEPQHIPHRPKAPVIWDRRLQLLGWAVPPRMSRGEKVEIKLYYKVLQAVGGKWKSLMHFDGPLRFNGDHYPIDEICPTSAWMPGDYIVDTHTIRAGGGAFPQGRYDLWIGFFTGQAPNWKNMSVSEAPPDMRDTADRVKITSIVLD